MKVPSLLLMPCTLRLLARGSAAGIRRCTKISVPVYYFKQNLTQDSTQGSASAILNPGSKREREAYRPEFLVIPLALELFCLGDIGKAHPEAAHRHAEDRCEVGYKKFFIHAVTAGEGIAVEQDVPGHGHSVHGGEHVDPKACAACREPVISSVERGFRVAAWVHTSHAEIVRQVPPKSDLHPSIPTSKGISQGSPYKG